MKQNNRKTPLRHPDFAANCDLLFGLIPLAFMAVYLYGPRPAMMLAVSLLTALVCDFIVAKMRRQHYDASENSSLVFAAAFTLMLPATAAYYIVAAGTAPQRQRHELAQHPEGVEEERGDQQQRGQQE